MHWEVLPCPPSGKALILLKGAPWGLQASAGLLWVRPWGVGSEQRCFPFGIKRVTTELRVRQAETSLKVASIFVKYVVGKGKNIFTAPLRIMKMTFMNFETTLSQILLIPM